MRTRTMWLASLLVGWLALTPATAQAQAPNAGDPAWQLPLPLMLDHKETGFYTAAEFTYMRLNNPVEAQILAVRGFIDNTGLIRGGGPLLVVNGAAGDTTVTIDPNAGGPVLTRLFRDPGIPGQFIGSRQIALQADDGGSDKYSPGYRLTLGYKFDNDIALEFVFNQQVNTVHSASAGINAFDQNFRTGFQNSFLFSPMYNFSPLFAGPLRDIISNVFPFPLPVVITDTITVDAADTTTLALYRGMPIQAYGIWNGAEEMTTQFEQQWMSWEINARFPVCQTQLGRTYMIVGPRFMRLTESFEFRTVDYDVDGFALPSDSAKYHNQIENRMFGVQCGMGNEAYVGNGFALSLQGRLGLFANARHAKVRLERGDDLGPTVMHDWDDTSAVPMAQLGAYVWWYPTEGIQIRAGYEFMGMCGIRRSPHPVAFDVGTLVPEYKDTWLRMDGFTIGVALIF